MGRKNRLKKRQSVRRNGNWKMKCSLSAVQSTAMSVCWLMNMLRIEQAAKKNLHVYPFAVTSAARRMLTARGFQVKNETKNGSEHTTIKHVWKKIPGKSGHDSA
jgi:hypothetical protein